MPQESYLALTLVLAPIAVLKADKILSALPISQALCQLHLHRYCESELWLARL